MVPESILALNISVSVSKAKLEEPEVPETESKAAGSFRQAHPGRLIFHIRPSACIQDFQPTASTRCPELGDKSRYPTSALCWVLHALSLFSFSTPL